MLQMLERVDVEDVGDQRVRTERRLVLLAEVFGEPLFSADTVRFSAASAEPRFSVSDNLLTSRFVEVEPWR